MISPLRHGALALAFVLSAGALAAQPKGGPYTSAEGRYAVKFPGAPKVTTPTAKTALGDLQLTVATYAADTNVFLSSHTDYPAEATKRENRKTLFDGVRDGLKGTKGTLVSEKDFEFGPDKLPARDVVVDRDQGKQRVKLRAVLRDNRLYQVVVVGTADFVAGKDATAFLESLELAK